MNPVKTLFISFTFSLLATLSGCVNHTSFMEENYGAVKGELPTFSDPKLAQLAAEFKTGRDYARAKGTLQYDPSAYPVCDISEAAFKKLIGFQEGQDLGAMMTQATPAKPAGSLATQATAASSGAFTMKEHVTKFKLLAYELRTSPEECEKHKNGTATLGNDYITYSKIQMNTHSVMNLNGKDTVNDSGQLTEETKHMMNETQLPAPGQPLVSRLNIESLSSVRITDGAGALVRAMVGDMGSYTRTHISGVGVDSITFMENNLSKGIFTTMHSFSLEGGRTKSVTYQGKEIQQVFRTEGGKRHGLQETYNRNAYLGNTLECYELGERVERPDCLQF